MPTGKYLKTKSHKKKISKSLIGHKVSLETRKKISINTKKAMNRKIKPQSPNGVRG